MMKNIWSKILFFCTLILVSNSAFSQQDTLFVPCEFKTQMFFRFDKSRVDHDYLDNQRILNELVTVVSQRGGVVIDSILIVSQSSPEGPFTYNTNLSHRRASSIKNYMEQRCPEIAHLLRVEGDGESWRRLREFILQDQTLSSEDKGSLVQIIDSDVRIQIKKRRLESHPKYKYLLNTHYKRLRYSAIHVIGRMPVVLTTAEELSSYDEIEYVEDTLYLPPDTLRKALPLNYTQKELFYLRTNFLVPLSNFGVEVALGNNWSMAADYYFPWIFRNPNHKNCLQLLGWNLEGRYWFGKERRREDRLEGHSIGLGGSFGYYDFEKQYEGIQGEFINVGLDYQYSIPICKDKLHMEFSLGVGYIYSYLRPYDVFEDGGKGYRKGYSEKFHWIGPNKASVSLVVPIRGKRRLAQ